MTGSSSSTGGGCWPTAPWARGWTTTSCGCAWRARPPRSSPAWRFGEVSAQARELTVPSLAMSLVPDVVAALVAAGARVVSVEPGQVSLEEKLLELLARNDEEHP